MVTLIADAVTIRRGWLQLCLNALLAILIVGTRADGESIVVACILRFSALDERRAECIKRLEWKIIGFGLQTGSEEYTLTLTSAMVACRRLQRGKHRATHVQ